MKQEGKGGEGRGGTVFTHLYTFPCVPYITSYITSYISSYITPYNHAFNLVRPPPTTRGRKHCGPAWWGGEVVPTVSLGWW